MLLFVVFFLFFFFGGGGGGGGGGGRLSYSNYKFDFNCDVKISVI